MNQETPAPVLPNAGDVWQRGPEIRRIVEIKNRELVHWDSFWLNGRMQQTGDTGFMAWADWVKDAVRVWPVEENPPMNPADAGELAFQLSQVVLGECAGGVPQDIGLILMDVLARMKPDWLPNWKSQTGR